MYLLTQAYPRSRVERKEHERVGSQEGLSTVYKAIRVEFLRCVCGRAHDGRWVGRIIVRSKKKR